MTIEYINLPGINGSDERHWHSIWEQDSPVFKRFSPASWNEPDLDSWIDALDHVVEKHGQKVVLIAHSLACLLVAHWSIRSELSVAGAMLVSVPDPCANSFPPQASSFKPLPTAPLRFPSCIVASRNDPYGDFNYMKGQARVWGSGFVDAGESDHIGSEASQDGWLFGQNILAAFSSGLS